MFKKDQFSTPIYTRSLCSLKGTENDFKYDKTAHSTGDFKSYAPTVDPKKLKKNAAGIGMRESCYDPDFKGLLSIFIAEDQTGSMSQLPFELREKLPTIVEVCKAQGHSDNVNVLACVFDDETVESDGCFQMSQFETDSDSLLKVFNEFVMPHNGGGNYGESYHLPIYAAARHTKLECWDKNAEKGFFFLIGDEPPHFNGDPKKYGTSKEIALSIFGDHLQAEVPMVDSLKEVAERYHVFTLRPHDTAHGTDPKVQKAWQDLFSAAGLNPQHVVQIKSEKGVKAVDAVVPTIALLIGRVLGADDNAVVDVLKTTGAIGIGAALASTKGLDLAVVENAIASVPDDLAVSAEGCDRV